MSRYGMNLGLGLSLLRFNGLGRRGSSPTPPTPTRPEGLIGQYKPYLNSNDSPTRDVLKDYSGNGNDIQLYNFAFAENSGYGLYAQNFNNWVKTSNSTSVVYPSYNKVRIELETPSTNVLVASLPKAFYNYNKSFKVKCTSNIEKVDFCFYKTGANESIQLNVGGITEIPAKPEYELDRDVFIQNTNRSAGFIELEIIPDYPGALVSDGVDDYGLCENFPILTKEKGFTICAIRKHLFNGGSNTLLSKAFVANQGEFVFENSITNEKAGFYSFGRYKSDYVQPLFSYMTSNNINGNLLEGEIISTSFTNELFLFCLRRNNIGMCSAALYALEIYDHDLTDEEIEKVKEAMYEEYLTATNALQNHIIADYECYDKTNEDEDRDVLKDLSGNGHDIQLYNFGFAEGSGYGLYANDFTNWHDNKRGDLVVSSSLIEIKSSLIENSNLIETISSNVVKEMKVRITGVSSLSSENYLIYVYYLEDGGSANYISISKDGYYTLPESLSIYTGFRIRYKEDSCNITIEQIPEYQGALVSDGVDDYGLCENFPILNKEDGFTILAIRKWLNAESDSDKIFLSNSAKWTAGFLGAFSMERINSSGTMCNFFGNANYVTDIFNPNTSFVYQTNNSYQGKIFFNIGSEAGQDVIVLFCSDEAYKSWKSSIAFYRSIILNKNCSIEEIKFIAKQMAAKHKKKTGETIELNF